MNYEIHDNGASIRVISSTGEQLIYKEKICQLIATDKILIIKTGDALLDNYLPFAQISLPQTDSILLLRDLVNSWITAFLGSGNQSGSLPSLDNGLSISSGKMTLGNNSGSNTAALSSSREFPMNGQKISFTSTGMAKVMIDGNSMEIDGKPVENAKSGILLFPGTLQTEAYSIGGHYSPTAILLTDDSNGPLVSAQLNGSSAGLEFNHPDRSISFLLFLANGKIIFVGSDVDEKDGIDGYDSNADFNCNSSFSFCKTVTHLTTNTTIATGFTGNGLFTNKGATGTVNVSILATHKGNFYTFYLAEAQLLTISANRGYTIRLGGSAVTTRSIKSSMPGSSITLCLVGPTEWFAIEQLGIWTTN